MRQTKASAVEMTIRDSKGGATSGPAQKFNSLLNCSRLGSQCSCLLEFTARCLAGVFVTPPFEAGACAFRHCSDC